MQQILITVQESENGVLVDSQQRKQQKASESTKWSYNLEWVRSWRICSWISF